MPVEWWPLREGNEHSARRKRLIVKPDIRPGIINLNNTGNHTCRQPYIPAYKHQLNSEQSSVLNKKQSSILSKYTLSHHKQGQKPGPK